MTMHAKEILRKLQAKRNRKNTEGMARYGINVERAYGVPIPVIRKMAKEIGRDHALALELWDTGVHEARILAALVDDPIRVTASQMDRWARDFDSWDLCDQCCMNLFDKTSYAYRKASLWSARRTEFVKRAAFALMAALSVHDKVAEDGAFTGFLQIIEREASDERNFVKKAVNWALRQIGKRNRSLNREAIATARRLQKTESRSAKWIASDAIRELTSEKVQERFSLR